MLRTLGLFAILLCSTASIAEVSDNWKAECIGRYLINVPGDVEVIFSVPPQLSNSSFDPMTYKYLSGSTMSSFITNPDPAPFSRYIYFGEIGITPDVPPIDFENLRKSIKGRKQQYLDNALRYEKDGSTSAAKDHRKYASQVQPLDYDSENMFGWGINSSTQLYLYQNNRIFILKVDGAGESKGIKQKQFNIYLNDFRARALFEVPKEQGICIPYGFIPDNGIQPHEIAVTMRLIDHPDIEVGLRDTTYQDNTYVVGDHTKAYLSPRDAINSFFDSSGITNADEKEEVNFPGYHSVEMNGQKGGAVFVTITRNDGSEDYGYVATVQGTADTPSLLLYVIRTASRAKGKPIGKYELKDMAKKIITSVKRHPVQ